MTLWRKERKSYNAAVARPLFKGLRDATLVAATASATCGGWPVPRYLGTLATWARLAVLAPIITARCFIGQLYTATVIKDLEKDQ